MGRNKTGLFTSYCCGANKLIQERKITDKEQTIIEKHVDSHGGGWYNIVDRYTDGIKILWGKGNRQYLKFIKIKPE